MSYVGLLIAGVVCAIGGVLVDPGVGSFLTFAGGMFLGVWLVVR